MKKQRLIHLVVPPVLVVGALVAWHYLPPWLAHNPGVLIILVAFIAAEIAHFILHDK